MLHSLRRAPDACPGRAVCRVRARWSLPGVHGRAHGRNLPDLLPCPIACPTRRRCAPAAPLLEGSPARMWVRVWDRSSIVRQESSNSWRNSAQFGACVGNEPASKRPLADPLSAALSSESPGFAEVSLEPLERTPPSTPLTDQRRPISAIPRVGLLVAHPPKPDGDAVSSLWPK
jgi:hypothetical protein